MMNITPLNAAYGVQFAQAKKKKAFTRAGRLLDIAVKKSVPAEGNGLRAHFKSLMTGFAALKYLGLKRGLKRDIASIVAHPERYGLASAGQKMGNNHSSQLTLTFDVPQKTAKQPLTPFFKTSAPVKKQQVILFLTKAGKGSLSYGHVLIQDLVPSGKNGTLMLENSRHLNPADTDEVKGLAAVLKIAMAKKKA